MRVGVHERATETELADAALELLGRRLRVLQRQRGEPREALRVLGDGRRQQVVDRRGPGHGDRGVGLGLDAGCVQGELLHVEPRLVHGREPLRGEVEQPAGGLRPDVGLGDARGARAVARQLLGDEVLFQSARAHRASSSTHPSP